MEYFFSETIWSVPKHDTGVDQNTLTKKTTEETLKTPWHLSLHTLAGVREVLRYQIAHGY